MCKESECKECYNLGHSLGDMASGAMLITLSPDPLRNGYGEKTPEKQKKWIIDKINKGLQEIRNLYRLEGYAIHFELNKKLNLHVHMLFWVDIKYMYYDIHCATISKIYHKLIGRPGSCSTWDSDVQWVKDYDAMYIYLNKENVFPPIHSVIKDFTNTITLVSLA